MNNNGGYGDKYYFNSVSLTGALSTGTGPSAAFSNGNGITSASATNIDVRDNVFSMSGSSTSTPKLYAHYTTLTGYAGSTLDRNDLVSTATGTATAQLGFFNSADRATLAAWQTATAQDAASISANPQFNSSTNLQPQLGSPVIAAGVAIAGITTDILGVSRGATPSVGAYEQGLDSAGPNLVYTPLANTASTASRTLTVSATDSSGVPTSGAGLPVLYYRKGASGAFTPATSTFTSGSNYDVIFDYAPLGGVVPGDVIQYFVAAQDGLGNGSANPSAGAAGFTANPPAYATPPSAPNSYRIAQLLAGAYNVGAGGDYPSLTNAGGLFEAINGNAVSGNLIINITSDLTAETGANALNQWVESGAGGYTMLVRPSAAPRVISGASTGATGLIKLNGADRVTIDGSTSGGTDQSLTISNANASGVVMWIASASVTDGANNNTVKNCVISGGATGSISGVLSGSGATLGSAADAPNSNNTIQNNAISTVQNALFLSGATGLDQNWVIVGNTFGSTVTANKLSFRGMFLGNAQGFTITANSIAGVLSAATSTATVTGIQLGGVINGGTITANRISDIKQVNTTGYGSNGVYLTASSTASNVTVANNFIWDVASYGFAGVTFDDNGYGIMVQSGGGYRIYDNSISLGTSQTLAGSITAAVNIAAGVTTAGSIDLRNNILANTETVGTRYAVYNASTAGAAIFAAINYNDYFAQNVGFQTTAQATLGAWQVATTQDVNSIAADPIFTSASDLHLASNASPASNAGTTIAGVNADIDGNARSASRPEIGADELPPSANLGNLTISAGTLNPAFATGTLTYTASVGHGTASITTTPTVADTNATVQVRVNGGSYAPVTSGSPSGPLALNVGANPIDVQVTGEFGAPVLTYTVTVTRAAAPPIPGALAIATTKGNPVTFSEAALLALGTDPGGFTPLTLIGVGQPTGGAPTGSVTNSPGVSITFTPDVAFTGTDTFAYTIQNTQGVQASGTITVTVTDFVARAVSVSNVGGTFSATFAGVPNVSYRIEYTDSLLVAFQPLLDINSQPVVIMADGTGNFSFSQAGAPAKRFFRARALP